MGTSHVAQCQSVFVSLCVPAYASPLNVCVCVCVCVCIFRCIRVWVCLYIGMSVCRRVCVGGCVCVRKRVYSIYLEIFFIALTVNDSQ